jgi:aquaporin rerated protein, other eukaryote
LSFAVSLAITCWIFFRVSGGQFNPAVTLGLCMIGAITWTRGCLILPAQLAGAIAAACVVKWLYDGPLAVTTYLAGQTTIAQGLFIEMFLTALLVFSVMMLAAERHKTTFLAPIGIGMALFVAELAGVCECNHSVSALFPGRWLTRQDYTGGSLNPARSFGPCVATVSFRGEHWIYWAGPCLGAVVAAGLFKFLKSMKYDSANPGQDLDSLELNAKILDEKLESLARPLSSVATMVGAQDFGWDTPTKDNPSEYTASPSPHRQTLDVPRGSMQSARKVRISDEPPPTPSPIYKGRPCTQCGSH